MTAALAAVVPSKAKAKTDAISVFMMIAFQKESLPT